MIRFTSTSLFLGIALFYVEVTGQTDSQLQPPVFSIHGGIYDNPVTITITPNSPDEKIYLTSNGSEPTTRSFKYNSQLTLTKTTVVRAKSFINDSTSSNTVTNTYIINAPSDLPVISICTNPYNLWDNDYGIYVMGKNAESSYPYFGANFWQDWERPIHIEMYEPDGAQAFSMDAGIKIYGNWSRAIDQKSLAVFARKIYGEGKIKYKIFPDLSIDKFESFILRNSANDWNTTMFRDAMMHALVKNTGIDMLAYRPATIYLNGEYWGILNIREKVNEHYIAAHHNVNPDSIDLLENNGTVLQGSNSHYKALVDFISKKDISIQANYEYVKLRMDVDEFISYMIAEIYFANTDWPGNNIKFWRLQKNDDKWRWILFDTDFGFDVYNEGKSRHNTLKFVLEPNGPSWPNPPWSTLLLRRLIVNNEFKTNFINRFADFSNTIFQADNVKKVIRKFKTAIQNEIPKHLNRWNGGDVETWNTNVSKLEKFADERIGYLTDYFKEEFNINSTLLVYLNLSDNNAGKIKLNSLELNTFPWHGFYYKGTPVTLTAVAKPGYKFKEWKGIDAGNKETITVPTQAALVATAVFELDTAFTNKIIINEINYNSSPELDTEDWFELYNADTIDADISGWIFKDEDDAHVFAFPANTVLKAKDYLVVCRDTIKFSTAYPSIKNRIGNFDFGLNNGGEKVRLFDWNLNIIDSLTFNDKSPWPENADGTGATLALIDPLSDNSLAQNWIASVNYGTPGRKNNSSTFVNETDGNLPAEYSLSQNYPNPFNPVTTIEYSIPSDNTSVKLTVYDILGREAAVLVNEVKNAGTYKIIFNANDLPYGYTSGVYFYQLKVEDKTFSKKFVLLK